MSKKCLPHGITTLFFIVFIVLGLASGTTDYNARGDTQFEKGNYEQAIEDYTDAIRQNPNNAYAYYSRAVIYVYHLIDYDCAIADAGQVIKLRPNAEAGFFVRGRAYFGKGNYDLAIADFTEVIRLNPNYAMAYNNRAWIYAYHLKRDYDRAIADVNQAILLDPNKEYFYLDTRGWAYLGNGDYDKAIADFEKALQVDPNLQSSIDGLARARRQAAQ
jgi:tetratricopeptide (TPR) repeat protein